MADPQIPVTTIKYKTYVKKTLVEGLTSVFASHTDPFLAGMKVTIDFPMTEMDYPCVVVRFYERQITNAGIDHHEWSGVDNVYNDVETWFDPFNGTLRTAQDYSAKVGAYVPTGILGATNELIPWTPSVPLTASTGQRATARITRVNNENFVTRVLLAASLTNRTCFIGEVTVTGSNATSKLIYRNNSLVETVLATGTPITGIPRSGDIWADFNLNYDNNLTLHVGPTDPLSNQGFFTNGSTVGQATAPQMASLDDTNSRFGFITSGTGTLTAITLFRTFKTHVSDVRLHKYKHYLYKGDIEFAVYALSSYDRDLVSDTLIQTLAMGDLENWTNQLGERVYQPDATATPASIDHMININTDTIQGFGETQQIAPWNPEDVMVYQTSYRVGIFGEFYSLTPTNKTYGLVENIDTFPYMGDVGDPVPDPPNPGPDHIYGTADDIADSTPWT